MQILDLQSQLENLAAQNRSLEEARAKAEEAIQQAQYQRQVEEQVITEAVQARDREIQQKDIDIAQLRDTLQQLQQEIARLTELNHQLTEANHNLSNDTNQRYAQLQAEGQQVHDQWQQATRELEELRAEHSRLRSGVEEAVRGQIASALDARDAQVKALQKQLLVARRQTDSFLTIRDEDYFDSACQQLCQHVQQWVLRFSKYSDTRACRLSSEVAADRRLDPKTREKIETRIENTILDGSDPDMLLADRVKRRDVFMSLVMYMIWEYVFTRYLFGMDREQRQKLKVLEKTLTEVGKWIGPLL
jgi:DNA repair exonuclease SbcCD ATPase subunit